MGVVPVVGAAGGPGFSGWNIDFLPSGGSLPSGGGWSTLLGPETSATLVAGPAPGCWVGGLVLDGTASLSLDGVVVLFVF